MSKKIEKYFNELWRLSILYLFVIASLWVPWHEVGEVFDAVDSKADIIKIYGHIFMMLVVLVVPVMNIFGVIESMRPGAMSKGILAKIGVGKILIVIVGGLIALSFFLRHNLMEYVKNNGYVYCEEVSESTTFSKEYVFVRKGGACEANITTGYGDENEY